jgi:hypothetical protein
MRRKMDNPINILINFLVIIKLQFKDQNQLSFIKNRAIIKAAMTAQRVLHRSDTSNQYKSSNLFYPMETV